MPIIRLLLILGMFSSIGKAQTSQTYSFFSPTPYDTLNPGDDITIACGNVYYTEFESFTTAISTQSIGIQLYTPITTTIFPEGIKLEQGSLSYSYKFTALNLCQVKKFTIKRYVGMSGSTPNFNYLDFYIRPNDALSVKEMDKLNVKVYPNPTTDKLIIESDNNEQLNILIFNSLGEVVLSERYSDKINLEKLSKGLYTLRIFSDNQVFTQKIVKQ